MQIILGHGFEEDITTALWIFHVKEALVMRFGNTKQELMLAPWIPYTSRHLFYSRGLATVDGEGNKLYLSIKIVYIEYGLRDSKPNRVQPPLFFDDR